MPRLVLRCGVGLCDVWVESYVCITGGLAGREDARGKLHRVVDARWHAAKGARRDHGGLPVRCGVVWCCVVWLALSTARVVVAVVAVVRWTQG